MKTPFPTEPVAKAEKSFQQALRPRGGESGIPELPTDLTVKDAVTRWRDGRAPHIEPLLAAGELHGVMPRQRRR
ncbi:hypothetical protein D3C86_391780 [compost metagenome]